MNPVASINSTKSKKVEFDLNEVEDMFKLIKQFERKARKMIGFERA